MKEKYGEITMLDFPQFTKDTFPGVTRMDLFSGLFGDVTDDAMFFPAANGRPGGFDPMSPSGRKWLDTLANTWSRPAPRCSTSRTTRRPAWPTTARPKPTRGARPASRWPSAGSRAARCSA